MEITSNNNNLDNSRATSGGYGSGTGYGSTGTHTTSGPHSSNLANKADPRVDSDRGRLLRPCILSNVACWKLTLQQTEEAASQVDTERAVPAMALPEHITPLGLTLQTWLTKPILVSIVTEVSFSGLHVLSRWKLTLR